MNKRVVLFTLGIILLGFEANAQWVQTAGPYIGHPVYSLAVKGTQLFAGTNTAGAFRSTDNGITWTAIDSGITNLSVRAMAVSGSNLFAGTESGVFLSTNNGTSWTEVNTGLTN